VAPVKVMLLGPPRVERDGEPVAFDTRKAIALLAHLALVDRPRSRDALAELLWPGHDTDHARGALRRTLSTLRSAVGAGAVEAGRDRVRLVKAAGVEVDVDRFRSLVAAGAFEPAVALFRGEFLEGFGVRDAPAFDDWQRAEGDALERELAAALTGLADAAEAAGNLAGAIAHARRRLELDPLHEPAHRRLIRLFARGGDRAAALAQYRECVRTLSRELGVPPLEETTRLYEAISEGTFGPPDPPPAGLGRELRASAGAAVLAAGSSGDLAAAGAHAFRTGPLVGRDTDWRALTDAYEAVGPDGSVVLLEGEAGIGKTRLAEELLAHAAARGASTLRGRGYEEESGLAYGPLVEALRGRLRQERGWLDVVGDRALGEAARLVGELAEARQELAPPPPLDGPGAEARFLDGVWEVLTAAAAAGAAPGILLLDDVQWADEASLGLLAYGLRRLTARPLLVLLTWRTPYEHRLRNVVADAQRAGHGTVRRLERLSPAEVGELLGSAAASGRAERLYEETEGLPFLLVEYLVALRDAAVDPSAPAVASGVLSLPSGARDLLRARFDPVSETGRQVLAAAAVIGRSFDVETVRAVSGRGDEEAVAALEELVRRGLVREGAADYDFAHEQLRALAYEETSLARRRLLHGRAADALGRDRAAAAARHLALAGRDAEAAAAHARAADHARALYANAQALEHLDAALALGHPDPAPLHAQRGDLQTLLGDYASALGSYETAAAHGRSEALAGLEHRLGRLHHRRGDRALAEAHLQAALTAAPEDDLALRAEVHADLSLNADDGGDPVRAAALASQALTLAERAGDPRALGRAHNLLGVLATSRGALGEALAHLERSRALAEETGDLGARVAALNNLALARRAGAEFDRALELTRTALELCAAQGDRHREAALRNNLADLLHAAGRPDEAMDELKRAVTLFAEVGGDEPRPEVWKLARW